MTDEDVRSSCESSNNPPAAGAAAPTTSTSLLDLERAAPSLLQAAETEQSQGQLRSCTSDNFCFSPLASEQDDVGASSQTVSVLDRDESPKMTALVQPAAEGAASTSGDKEARMPRQMKEAVCLFIFRRDLRVVDNPALRAAALRYRKVICCFIFTPEQIDPTQNRLYNHRAVKFMMECLTSLRQELLRDYDATLEFFFGDNVEVLEEIYACFQTSPLLAATTRYGDNDHGLLGGTADLLRPATSPTHQGEGGGRSNRRHDERLLLGGAPAPTLLEENINSANPPSDARRRGFPFQHHLPLGAIAFNEDYSYYARVRDDRLRAFCKRRGLQCLVRENYTLMPRKFFLDPVDDEAFTTQQDFLNFAHTPEVRAVILQECLNGCKDELAQAQEGVEEKSKSSAVEIEPDFPPDPVGGGRAAAGGDPEAMTLTCSSRAPSSALSASSYEQGLTKKFASGTSLLPMPRKLGKRLRAACGSTTSTSTGKGKTNIKNKKDTNHHDQQHTSDTFQLSARAAFSQLPAYQQGQARFRFLCRLYADRELFADYLVGGRANAQLLMEYCRSLRYETVDWNEMVGCTGAASTRNTTSDSTTAYSGASDAQSRSSRSSNQSYTPSSSKNNLAPSEQLRSESIAAAGPPPGRQAWQHSTSDSRRFPAREDDENEVVGHSPRSQTLSQDGCARPESDRDENETVAARKNHARLTHPVPTRMLPQLDHPPQKRSEKARASSPQRTIRPTTQEEYEERKLRSRYLRDGHVYDRVLQKRKASLSDYVPGGRGERAERGDESDDHSSKNTLNEEPASDPEGCDKAEQHMREQQKHLYTELVATRQGTQASSMLSPYVKFGCVSLRELFLFFEFAPELAQEVRDSSQNGILIKEFYATIAWYFPALFVRTTLNPVEAYAEAEGRANNRIREEDEDEDELRHAEKDQEGSGANEDENNVDDKLEHEDRPWHAKGEEEGEEIRIGCRPRNLQTTELDERNHATTVDAPLQHQVEVQQERVFGPKDAIREHRLQQTEQHRDAAHESSPGPLLTSAAACSISRSRGSSAEYYSTSQSELVNVISPIVTKTRSKSLPMASTGVPESTYFGSSTAGGPGGEQLSQFDRGAASTGCGGVDEQCVHQRQGGSGPQFREPPLDPHEGRGPLLYREWSTDSSSSSKPPAAPPLWTDSMGDDVKRHYQQKTLGPVVFVRSREHKEMLQALYSSTFFDSVRWVLDRHGNNALKAHLPWCAPVVVVTDHRGTTQKVDVFARWCIGATGFPFVDAGMRELNATGFMHYRARLVCANFLTRLLGINWTLGQEWFAKKQIDYDWSVNDGNWHLVTSMAFFAANFTKMVYDPFEQGRLFDPHCAYIKKWLPELAQVPNEVLHHWDHYSAATTKVVKLQRPAPGGPGGPGPSTPSAALASNPPAGGEEGDNYAKVVDMIKQVYPQPMISVRMAVKRCIQTYKQAQLKAAWFSPEAELPEDKACWGEEGRSEDGSSK